MFTFKCKNATVTVGKELLDVFVYTPKDKNRQPIVLSKFISVKEQDGRYWLSDNFGIKAVLDPVKNFKFEVSDYEEVEKE